MKKVKLPKTDSVQKLAEFWDRHDLTDFEGELEEIPQPVFVRRAAATTAIEVPLGRQEARAVERLARARGVSREELVRSWILQQIRRRSA